MRYLTSLKNKLPDLSLWIKTVWLAVLFCISSVFLFYNAFRFSLPIAYAGMYTLMAEQIADGGFSLPMQVPYYGPGGIPFAYPPLALYVMAVFLKLSVSAITYARFVPPIFSLLALIPLYLLVEDLTASHFAAGLAMIYAAFSPSLYLPHTTAAGIVRALSFLFMLWGFYFFNKTLREKRLLFGALAGVFFGLTTLTHLFYALFFALWAVCWTATCLNRQLWKPLAVAAFTATMVAAPWLYIVVSRYGVGALLNAFASHDNSTFIGLASQPSLLLVWMIAKFTSLSVLPLSFVLIGLGLIYLIVNRQFGMPLTLFVSILTLSVEGDRFIILLGSMLFGSSVLIFKKWINNLNWLGFIIIGVFGIALFQAAFYGVRETAKILPLLQQNTFEVADYIQENIPQRSRYLFVAGQSEAEWFPYLLQREPFVSKWGSEWLGTYDEQRNLQSQVSYCKDLQSVECLKQLNLEIMPADILITRKAEKDLSNELASFSACKKLASIGRYIIWQAQCLKQ